MYIKFDESCFHSIIIDCSLIAAIFLLNISSAVHLYGQFAICVQKSDNNASLKKCLSSMIRILELFRALANQISLKKYASFTKKKSAMREL